MTSQILDLVYTEKVREDEGGTYGVYVGGTLQKYPKEKAILQIIFDTAPEKKEKLMKIENRPVGSQLEQSERIYAEKAYRRPERKQLLAGKYRRILIYRHEPHE